MNRVSLRRLVGGALVFSLLSLLTPTISLPARAQTSAQATKFDPAKDVGLDQHLGQIVPMNTTFRDENGATVHLGDYFKDGKPVILNLIFYKCTGSCTLEIEGMVKTFGQMKFDVGKEFHVVTVSINPKETPELAAGKKKNTLDQLGRPGSESGWHFLTGSEDQIKTLAGAIGFRYVYDVVRDQWAHPAGIMILTPQGKLSRYFYGVDYSPKDVRLALVEASSNKIGTLADQVFLLCSHYDPQRGTYSFAILKFLRIAALGTILIVGAAILLMLRLEKRRAASAPIKPDERHPLTNA